jgi:predicted RNase H-like HicB family nuclease
MSVKSKTSRKQKPAASPSNGLDPCRPFDRGVLDRAGKLAAQYKLVIWFEDGEWYGRGLEVPDAMNDGKTPEACVRNVRDILTTHLAAMIERGETPPAPSNEQLRSEQVNIRLTPEEKLAMETAAQRQGFRGLSDYVRAAGVAKATG